MQKVIFGDVPNVRIYQGFPFIFLILPQGHAY